jgi:hypothetical protein
MKTIFKIFLAVTVLSTSLQSCETVELEQLANPLSLTEPDADFLLNSIQRAYVTNMTVYNDRSSELTRIDYMFGRDYFANYNSSTLDGQWSRTYSTMAVDLATIEGIAAVDDTRDYSFSVGVAKALQAHSLMLLVDFLGDVPYSEILQPDEFPNPNVDDDASVYDVALALLNEAGTLLDGSSAGGTITDFFYDGDSDAWVKMVNTLKMRHALTTGNTGGFNSIVSSGNFISSSADDFEFKYGDNLLNPNTRHQDYNADYTTSGANIYQSMWLMRKMQGVDASDESDDDPRMRYYFFRQADCTPGASCNPGGDGQFLSCSLESAPTHYAGIPYCYLEGGYWGRNHGDDDGTPPDNFLRTAVGVYPAAGLFDDDRFAGLNQDVGGVGAGIEPIILASYVDFWRAEVALAGGSAATAAGFVEAGLTKSIAKVQSFGALDPTADLSFAPSEAAVTAFITAEAAKITGTDDASWDALAENYFVTMYGGGSDAYNFYRRTGYPTTLDPNVEPNPGVFPRTFLYPSVEVNANPNIQQRPDNSDQVFWDTKPAGPAFPPAN